MSETIEKRSPEDALRRASAFFQLGNQLRKKGRPEQALVSYEKALTEAPNQASIINNIGLAHLEAQRPIKALRQFEMALKIDDQKEEYWHNKGLAKATLGDQEEAERCYIKATKINPKAACSWVNLGTLYKNLDKVEQAQQAYSKIIELGGTYRDEAQHMLNVIEGVHSKRAPSEYVSRLFDQYSNSYEAHLLRVLRFQVPNYLAQILCREDKNFYNRVLDGGCGTGLCGSVLRPFSKKLYGVDLSEKMLAIAHRKRFYDELERCDLDEFLHAQEESFDLMVFSDVFIYLGDLENTFAGVAKSLSDDGKAFFSIEWEPESKFAAYELRQSGRYQHSPEYVDSLLRKNNLQIKSKELKALRHESLTPLSGVVYFVSKLPLDPT